MARLKYTIYLFLLALISCKHSNTQEKVKASPLGQELIFEKISLDSLPKAKTISMGPTLTRTVGKTEVIKYPEKSRTFLPVKRIPLKTSRINKNHTHIQLINATA